MRATILGSGGWLPTDRRETTCVLLRSGADALLLDAGTGLRRLVTEPELLDGVERVSVALTHFHLDHSCGLVGVPALAERRVEIWAPASLLLDVDARSLVERLLGPPFLAPRARDLDPWIAAVHELRGSVSIGPFELETRVQERHPGRSVAIRVGELALCTDTAFDVDSAAFARGARVLLHEAFYRGDEIDDAGHSAAGEAARVAAEADVERLVLVHVNPGETDDDALAAAALQRFPATAVAVDRQELLGS